jgi:hypothetical protein
MHDAMISKFAAATILVSLVMFGNEASADVPADGSELHIVPLESPPLRVPTPVYGAWFGLVGIAMDAPRAADDAAEISREATEKLSRSAPWQPTIVLAEIVESMLDQGGKYSLSLAENAAPIPGLSGDEYTFFGENWLRPIRQWHKEKTSSVQYSDIEPLDSEYVLEVAVSNYELTGSRFLLAVNVKVVDLASRNVLDSARKWKQFRTPSFEELLEGDAEAFKELFREKSHILVQKALVDLGLI